MKPPMQTTTSSGPNQDVFQDSVTQIAKTARKQRKLVFIGAAMVTAVLAATSLYLSKRSAKGAEGQEAFYHARTLLASELKAVQASLPKPAAPAAPKNAKAPAPRAPEASITFERFSLTEKLPHSVAELEKVGKSYGGVLPGFEAYLLLGQTFLEHGLGAERARAVEYFTKAASAAPSTDKAVVAYYGLAFAQETEGQYAEAAKSFERVLNYGNTPFQADGMKGLARNYELQKDVDRARATYERIVSTFPDTDHARFARMKLAELPAPVPTEKK